MIKLNPDDLVVHSFSASVRPGGDDHVMLPDTDPRACPYTQGWNCPIVIRETDGCPTYADGCESGGGGGC
jgi:hypothetical protein